jgi:hypothetical protein
MVERLGPRRFNQKVSGSNPLVGKEWKTAQEGLLSMICFGLWAGGPGAGGVGV